MASGLCNPVADYKFEKITSGLRNPKYYKGAFFKLWKVMEVREEGMEV